MNCFGGILLSNAAVLPGRSLAALIGLYNLAALVFLRDSMAKEIELPIYGVDPEAVRSRLASMGARLVGKHSFRRCNFQASLPGSKGAGYYTKWVRVRTDGERTTITLKEQRGSGIEGRSEYEIEASSFELAVKILHKLMPEASFDYFENYREEYAIGELLIALDKFPMLEYSMEIEGPSKDAVMKLYDEMGVKGEIEANKSVPTSEYYRMHGADYSKLQESYSALVSELLSG